MKRRSSIDKRSVNKVLIYGVGNPYRTDDAVGIKVAEALKAKIEKPNITIKSGSIDGLAILDEILGYDRAIFMDSIKTEDGKPGDIYRIKVDPLKIPASLSVSHNIDFLTALRMGKKLGYTMPKSIDIYAIEIEDNTSFNEECTENIKASIPKLVEKVMEDIGE